MATMRFDGMVECWWWYVM